MNYPIFIVGFVFSVLAGICAFLITFIEWRKHGFRGFEKWREPLTRGAIAFIIFVALSLLLAYGLPLLNL